MKKEGKAPRYSLLLLGATYIGGDFLRLAAFVASQGRFFSRSGTLAPILEGSGLVLGKFWNLLASFF